jgi:hypothetical protein
LSEPGRQRAVDLVDGSLDGVGRGLDVEKISLDRLEPSVGSNKLLKRSSAEGIV